MADHFGSDGPYEGDGNDNLGGNPNTDELNYLNALNISSFGAPTSLTYPLSTAEKINVRSKMFPQAIRATAGLLYWFVTQVGMASQPYYMTYAVINGTSELYEGGTGNWAVDHDGPEEFTYSWEIKKLSSSSSLSSTAAVSSNSEVVINALPSDQWCPIGSNSKSLSLAYSSLDTRDYQLRCTVTDAVNTVIITSSFYVDIIDGSLLLEGIINNNTDLKTKMIESEIQSYSIRNYPNPFNPVTTIKYSLAEESYTTLKIYNVLSQEVLTLVDEVRAKGSYSVSFNGSGLPSGIYLAMLQTGKYSKVIKMQLIK